MENKTSKLTIKTTPKYKNKDNNYIPIAIPIENDSTEYSVTIPNDVIEGDLMVILVDNEEMIVNCREGKKSGDTIIISEDELIPQLYEYTVPEDIVIGDEFTILINNKSFVRFWNATHKPGQALVDALPRKKKTRNPDDDIEKIKNIEKYDIDIYIMSQ